MAPVAIVLPVRNAAPDLPAALESLRRQRHRAFDCVIVDNGSADGSPEIAAQMAMADGRFRLVQEPRQGIVFALNTGIEATHSPWIARMDADDCAHPARLEQLLAHASAEPRVDVWASQVAHLPNRNGAAPSADTGLRHYIAWSNRLLTHAAMRAQRFRESPVVHPSVMFRRELVARYGAYRHGDFPED